MKHLAKSLVATVLGWQVRRLRKRNLFQVIGVVGSIGKTSTKFAIASVLKEELRVQYQEGNYNHLVTVPLIFFGLTEPSLKNPFAWLRVFIKIEKQLKKAYSYDVVVVELGTDCPGQIPEFASYLRCDIAVVTAIGLEHMEFFASLDQVAEEELSVTKYADVVLANADLCSVKYLKTAAVEALTYGLKAESDYQLSDLKLAGGQANFTVVSKDAEPLKLSMSAVAIGEVYSATAAAVVAAKLGLSDKSIQQGVKKLKPVSGRMQRLKGIRGSLIIDESYNSSPEAAIEALNTLYRVEAAQKIAVLGNMNELGSFSPAAHQDIGGHCDPKKLDLVITIGRDANQYLAETAKKNGCQVMSFTDPYALGEKLKAVIKDKSAVLFKGSQNGVFLEEAIKVVLADPKDKSLLVRQSAAWLKKKRRSFFEN